MFYQYPLKLSFKLLALAPRVTVSDATGKEIFFVHMKAFKLKEDILVFSDSTKTNQIYRIQADRIIDFSATYNFTDVNGTALGSIKREGMRSIFKASYNVLDAAGSMTHHIGEDNGWIRVADAVLEGIPVIGMFSGYLFHPSYTAKTTGSEAGVMQLTKQPAFFESSFDIKALDVALSNDEEIKLLLSYIMMILLERQRG